ncbi:YHYH domain-containing protein [Metabacillus elymi]|uniref:YHYH domain-containing protein n=1 Tax=Metabacillus elymi TaxID=2745198 RepID=A0ABX6S8E6_9BACI|nr:YHYH domain-containing protein [Metabacillus sp. KUDC1714]QNF29646.1 YHYH domain-containing protein [Metabacillus sp. KUDC1714]
MKRFTILLVLLSLFSFQNIAEAHSGRTDSSGGHNCSDKSKAKGLCTGYHKHNGGSDSSSSSSSSSSGTSATTQSWDKDCSDFSSYEEVVEYWNSKGYSKTNDPEKLDGWGNAVDDGIPCEAPSGYDTSKINGSEAQLAKVTAEKDSAKGESEGYTVGLNDGSNGKGENLNITGSEAYVESYKDSYQKGYEEGLQKFESEKKKANEAGLALGSKQDKLVVPEVYQKKEQLRTAFEEGFNKGVATRDEAKKKEFEDKGYKNGLEDKHDEPKDVKEIYIDAYTVGYKKGQAELKEKYIKEGYDGALTMLEYKAPDYENEKYIEWYKEGFESNKEIKSIQEAAYNQGLSGEKYSVPKTYTKSEVIYKHYYDQGYEDYETEKKEDTATTAGGLGVIILGWLARRFYVAKKMVG